jgi:hypothetical protein
LKQLIIFSEFKDQSTNKVINWINFLGHSVIRINQDDTKFQVTDIQNDLISVKTFEGNHYINKDDIIWFRRLSVQSIFFVKDQKDVLQNSLYSFERLERNSIFRSLLSWLSSYCYCIGNPEMVSPDKINILQLGIAPSKYIFSSFLSLPTFAVNNYRIWQKMILHPRCVS